jgi:hypothetical protein
MNLRSGFAMSHTVRAIPLFLALLGAIPLSGCGGGGSGLPSSSQVTVLVTPSQTSVAVGGSVALKGSATGFTQTPIVQWWVQEAKNAGGSDDCGYLTPPPMSACQFGYVVFGSVSQFPSSATYYAPLTPGTYHVTFEATQFTAFDHLTKATTATINVTP